MIVVINVSIKTFLLSAGIVYYNTASWMSKQEYSHYHNQI